MFHYEFNIDSQQHEFLCTLDNKNGTTKYCSASFFLPGEIQKLITWVNRCLTIQTKLEAST